MATVADRLTERHRVAQLQLRALIVARAQRLLQVIDVDDLDTTWQAIEPALVQLINQGNRASAAVAADYYRTIRLVDIGTPYTPAVAPALTMEDVVPSLRVTGPGTIRRLAANGRAAEAAHVAVTNVSGTVTRLALNGGRDTITVNVDQDPEAVGWYRVTDADPCGFCAMLASRGAAYRSETTAGAHWHDHCGCSARPVFTIDTPPPDLNREFGRIWNEATAGLTGREARNAFRRAIETRT